MTLVIIHSATYNTVMIKRKMHRKYSLVQLLINLRMIAYIEKASGLTIDSRR